MRQPFLLWVLTFFLLVLSLAGAYGGIAMLADPSGSLLELDDVLHLLPVPNYTLPGLFLLTIMGGLPLVLAFALIARPIWPWVERLFRWSKHYWAWTGTLALVGILAIWLLVEGLMIGLFPITYATAIVGLLILVSSMFPSVRDHYAKA